MDFVNSLNGVIAFFKAILVFHSETAMEMNVYCSEPVKIHSATVDHAPERITDLDQDGIANEPAVRIKLSVFTD